MTTIKEGYVYRKGRMHFWYRRLFKLCDDGNLLGFNNSRLESKNSIVGYRLSTSEYGSKFIFTISDDNNACIISLYVESESERQQWIEKITPFHSRGTYKLLKLLGKGTFGKVFLCKPANSEQNFAMKVVNTTATNNRFDTEYRLMCTIKHPFLMSAYTSFNADNSRSIVMKFLPGGNMAEYLHKRKRLSEDHTRFYGAEIVSAVGYLHTLGVVHRDIKLENLMMDENGHVVLGDYGISVENMNSNSIRTEFEGTPSYMAPEMFGGSYGRSIDWWATGIVLHKMMIGKFPPFRMRKAESQYLSAMLSLEAEQLLLGLLDPSPSTRLGSSSTGYLEIQNQPFFAPIDWHKLNAKLIPTPYVPNLSLPLPDEHKNGAEILYGIFTRLR